MISDRDLYATLALSLDHFLTAQRGFRRFVKRREQQGKAWDTCREGVLWRDEMKIAQANLTYWEGRALA